MSEVLVAIPSAPPGGLDAAVEAHFGHCDLYTLVKIAAGQVSAVNTLPNIPHEQGGCMAAVSLLAENGVRVLIAGGMGLRPLMGFNQLGIEVRFGQDSRTVREAVEAFLTGRLPQFTPQFTCSGGEGHGHGCGS